MDKTAIDNLWGGVDKTISDLIHRLKTDPEEAKKIIESVLISNHKFLKALAEIGTQAFASGQLSHEEIRQIIDRTLSE